MNANEMADLMILFDSGRIYEHAEEIATMLRQQQTKLEKLQGLLREYTALHMKQQAEIEALKAVLEQEGIGVGRDLLNGGIALFRKAQNEQ